MRNSELLRMVNDDGAEQTTTIIGRIVLGAAAVLTAVAVSMGTASEAKAGGWESLGTWKCTAYCHGSCCNGRNAGRTASGAPMTDGETVAVGHLSFGTRLLIDGHEYVVEDRGVRGEHVDILFPSHKEANRFGVQYKQVFIWRD